MDDILHLPLAVWHPVCNLLSAAAKLKGRADAENRI